MSKDATTWFRTLRIGMSPLEKIVGHELAYRAQDDTHQAWPTLQRLSDDTEIPKRTVQRALEQLLARRVIEDTGNRAGNGAVIYKMSVKLKIEATAPVPVAASGNGQSDHGQSGHGRVANVATPSMANMASTSLTIVQAKQNKLTTAEIDRWFAAFWALYLRKEDKGHARKAFVAALNKGMAPEVIMEGLKRYQFSPDPKFRPLAATWLNGERWGDEAAAPPPERKNGFDPDWGRMF